MQQTLLMRVQLHRHQKKCSKWWVEPSEKGKKNIPNAQKRETNEEKIEDKMGEKW